MRKKYNVTDINLDEVSFVGKGANQSAHVVLMKRLEKAETKREMGEDFPASAFAYVPDPKKPSTWKLRLWDSMSEKETRSQIGAAVAALGKGFRGRKVQIPSDDLSGVKAKVLAAWLRVNEDKNRGDAPSILKSGGFMKKTLEELQKEFDELQKTHDKLVKTNDTLQKTHDDLVTEHDDLKKTAAKKDGKIDKSGMSDEVRKQFEEQETELKKQADMIAKMADDSLKISWIAKAGDVLLVGEAEEIGKLMKSIAETSPETAESLLVILKAANARIEKGNLFKEIGTGGEADTGALAELNKKAHELAKSEKITFEKAFSKIYKSDKVLRKQYLAETRG